MSRISREDFADLVGEDLSGVTFVRDYLQLQFNPPPLLNCYTPVAVRVGEAAVLLGEPAFANAIIGQIGKFVADVAFDEGEALIITFTDGSVVSVSLSAAHYVGPEAINLFRRDQTMIVV